MRRYWGESVPDLCEEQQRASTAGTEWARCSVMGNGMREIRGVKGKA